MARATFEERFWAKVIPEPNSGCLLWIGAQTNGGYGHMAVHGRRPRASEQIGAHVIAWEMAHGPLPEGYEPDHRCRVHSCVNERHMEAVTRRENQMRGHNTFTAINTAKTCCGNCGGPYTSRARGGRVCKPCRAGYERKRQRRLREQRRTA